MWTRRFAFILCLAAMALWGAALSWPRIWAGHNDFMAFYTGGLLAGTPDLYSSAANRAVSEHLGYWMPAVQYLRLPYYAEILKPLSKLSYQAAYFVFQGVCLAATGFFLMMGRRRYSALPWFALISVPILTSFANGQDVMIVVALSAAAVYLDEAGHPWLAGCCLALCTLKFHLFIFTPVALLTHRKWRFAVSAALGVALELAVSFAIAGSGWLRQYAEFLRNPLLHPNSYVRPNISGIAGGGVLLEIVLTLGVAALTLYLCWRVRNFPAAFTLSVFAGLLVAQHSYIQDCALLLLIPVFLRPESVIVRQIGTALLTPFPYFLLMADGFVGAITPILLLGWFVALAMDASGLIPQQEPGKLLLSQPAQS